MGIGMVLICPPRILDKEKCLGASKFLPIEYLHPWPFTESDSRIEVAFLLQAF